jgi:uncharacterized protein
MTIQDIGTVKQINRFPVKSFAGESLPSAELKWSGLDGDRQYAFYKAGDGSRFPWLTGRAVSQINTYTARFTDPGNPRKSEVRVKIGKDEYGLRDEVLRTKLSAALGEEVRLIQIGRGIFDTMPVSVMATATPPLVEAAAGVPIDPRRFRANLIIETPAGEAARETHWVGGTLIFGDGPDTAKLLVSSPIDRCVMITIDPDTGERNPAILRTVVERFDNFIASRCSPAGLGRIRVGDRVRLAR